MLWHHSQPLHFQNHVRLIAKRVAKFMALVSAWRGRLVSTRLDKENIRAPLQSLATMAIKEWSSPTATSQFIFTTPCSGLFQEETIGLRGTRGTLVSLARCSLNFFNII